MKLTPAEIKIKGGEMSEKSSGDEQYKGTKLDYPKDPCHNCKGVNFRYIGKGEWQCMGCVSGVPGSKEELIARAMLANHKMYFAWYALRQLTKGDAVFPEALAKFEEGVKKAAAIGRELKERGLTDCLYIENGKKLKKCNVFPNLYPPGATISNFFCHCCPNDYWWEKELFEVDAKRYPEADK